jgi:hypothetical protein
VGETGNSKPPGRVIMLSTQSRACVRQGHLDHPNSKVNSQQVLRLWCDVPFLQITSLSQHLVEKCWAKIIFLIVTNTFFTFSSSKFLFCEVGHVPTELRWSCSYYYIKLDKREIFTMTPIFENVQCSNNSFMMDQWKWVLTKKRTLRRDPCNYLIIELTICLFSP